MTSLDGIRVAKPCPASWAEMKGDDKVRHCSLCNLNVYNLTAMSRDEAEALIARQQGRLCVRYYRRDDGRVMTSDCPQGVRRVRRQRTRFAVGGLLAFLVNAVGMAAQPRTMINPEMGESSVSGLQPYTAPLDENLVMGKLVATPPATP